jgi:hypothetical protein
MSRVREHHPAPPGRPEPAADPAPRAPEPADDGLPPGDGWRYGVVVQLYLLVALLIVIGSLCHFLIGRFRLLDPR